MAIARCIWIFLVVPILAQNELEKQEFSPKDVDILNDQVQNGRRLLEEYYLHKVEALEKIKVLLSGIKKFQQERVNCEPNIRRFVEHPINSFRLIHELAKTNEAVESIILRKDNSELTMKLFTLMLSDDDRSAEELDPENQELYFVGKTAFKNGNFEGCANVMSYLSDQLIEKGKQDDNVLDNAIVCFYKMKDYEKALLHTYKLQQINPTHPKLAMYRTVLENNLPKNRLTFIKFKNGTIEMTVEEIIQEAKENYNNEKFEECAQYMEEVLDADLSKSKRIDCLDHLAFCMHRIGRNRKAYKYTLELLKLDPDNSRVKKNLQIFKGYLKDSIGEEVENINPVRLVAEGNDEFVRAKKLCNDGNYKQCLTKSKQVLKSVNFQQKKILFRMMSEAAYHLGQFSDASDYIKQLLEEDSDNSWAKAMKEKYHMKLSGNIMNDIGDKIISFAKNLLN